MPSQDEIAKDWQSQGFSAEQAAQLASELGWSPIETIKALKKHFDVGIGDGKALVDRTLDEPTRAANEYLRLQALLAFKMPAWATEEDAAALEAESGWNKKLFALVNAGRHDDAVAAIERFDPSTMRFRPLSLADAKGLVEEEIATWVSPMQILEDATQEHDFGWSFCYQSVRYVASGDFRDAVGGNGPFLVDRTTGAIWLAGSALPLDHYVRNYQVTGDPHRTPTDDPEFNSGISS